MSNLKVTHVPHTRLGRIKDSIAAWARGFINIWRLKRLSRLTKEGSAASSPDLRAGSGRRS